MPFHLRGFLIERTAITADADAVRYGAKCQSLNAPSDRTLIRHSTNMGLTIVAIANARTIVL
jgi:hypothetical protein